MTRDSIRIGHDDITFRVTSEESGGDILAAEVRLPAGGGPPMLHRHPPAEIYRVEQGELAIYVEHAAGTVRRIAARVGDVVHIPSGREHTVRNESTAEAQAYVVYVPGGEMERFVRAAGSVSSIDQVLALAERHGIEMTRPLPAPA